MYLVFRTHIIIAEREGVRHDFGSTLYPLNIVDQRGAQDSGGNRSTVKKRVRETQGFKTRRLGATLPLSWRVCVDTRPTNKPKTPPACARFNAYYTRLDCGYFRTLARVCTVLYAGGPLLCRATSSFSNTKWVRAM